MNRSLEQSLDRRALGRALSRAANASIEEILSDPPPDRVRQALRIGVTGPPGAGKSTLIAALARHRLEHAGRVAILAIDPSSPRTRGAVLGDRIRMDGLVDDPRIYIRSLASRGAADGLTENLPEILAVLDRFGFDEIILETVGVGQAEFAVRELVDVELLVMMPGAGDQIQAMKAGILETADVYVVNKGDLPGANRVEAELRGILAMTAPAGGPPPVVRVRADAGDNMAELDAAIAGVLASRAITGSSEETRHRRIRQRVRGLVLRRIEDVLARLPAAACDRPLRQVFDHVIADLTNA